MSRWDTSIAPNVGDVVTTREGHKLISGAIRLGARIAGLPHYVNHVIIVHHKDKAGTLWGIEGRPGGVGWVDLRTRLQHPLTNVNNMQPKTDEQRYLIAVAAEQMLGVAYDWAAIAEHTGMSIRELFANRIPEKVQADGMWTHVREWKEDVAPAHVVCSSFADWAYETVGLSNPGSWKQTRMTTPGHWDKFIMDREWERT